MKFIELTKGKVAIVDEDVHAWLAPYSWHVVIPHAGKMYAMRSVFIHTKYLGIYMHRLIAGVPTEYRIRFLDGNTLNYCRQNLAIYSKMGSRIGWPGSCRTSAMLGVSWNQYYGLWEASIKGLVIGHYRTEIEAALAYNEKALEFSGNARINKFNFVKPDETRAKLAVRSV